MVNKVSNGVMKPARASRLSASVKRIPRYTLVADEQVDGLAVTPAGHMLALQVRELCFSGM